MSNLKQTIKKTNVSQETMAKWLNLTYHTFRRYKGQIGQNKDTFSKEQEIILLSKLKEHHEEQIEVIDERLNELNSK